MRSKDDNQIFQTIAGRVMFCRQMTRYAILYVVAEMTRAMSEPSKAHVAAAKPLLRNLAGTSDSDITYEQGGLKRTAFSDANWRHNPGKGKSMSSYVISLSNAPEMFEVGLQGLTVQPTMKEELVAAALAIKEAAFCSIIMKEVGFGTRFDSVSLYIDNNSALHVAGDRAYSSRVKHFALLCVFIQGLAKQGITDIHYVKTADQLAKTGTK